MPAFRVGLIGPDQTQPCGIADYTSRLRAALAERCDLAFIPFRSAASADLGACEALLVQYERSLAPDAGFLKRLARRHGRVFVVPHEVYLEDPFAFPYSQLRSAFPPLLWLKRMRYRWRHRHYGREQTLQALAYHAHRVIPVSPAAADILRAADPGVSARILPPIPLACPDPSAFPAGAPVARARWFAKPTRHLIGIFGFLNPSHDYGLALDLVEALGPEAGLLIAGGYREGEQVGATLHAEIARRGMGDRVEVTGYLPPESLEGNLRLCDLFLSPLKFKSSSASLLDLFHLGKPILAADLPLTRFLRGEGAPIDLYADADELGALAADFLSGKRRPPQVTYRWSFAAAADAYLKAMLSS